MRQIKFRAWVKDERFGREMLNVVMISWMKDGEIVLSGKGGSVMRDKCELMQFTGLTDYKGKEIYESDILRYSKVVPKGQKPIYHYWKVLMSPKGQWCIQRKDVMQSLASATKNHEIIGDIHTTPDLLKSND